jgi:outer membrane assembly lipoprotein YfiO
MSTLRASRRRLAPLVGALLLTLPGAIAGCLSSAVKLPAPGSVNADQFLFDTGSDRLAKKNWLTAREYFKKLVDTFPQSPYRQQARLGIGDTYLGEGRTDTVILGVNEFREFLRFFPLNPRADYAQYRICFGTSKQMLGPQRDQTATLQAIKECDVETFRRNYPGSSYQADVEKLYRLARDRSSDSDYQKGMTYFKLKWWPGAQDRFSSLLIEDPAYGHRDAVYFYLAETLVKETRVKEALPLYERLVGEFPKSEFLKRAMARIAELKR